LAPFHATVLQALVKTPVPELEAVQVIPSVEYARRFVPPPPVTYRLPLYPKQLTPPVITLFPDVDAYQLIPSYEYPILFDPPPPPINHSVPLHREALTLAKGPPPKMAFPEDDTDQLIPSYEYTT
jgi:hypothetical protein